jgi:diguanylate cyclase (GGDEF)-like protein
VVGTVLDITERKVAQDTLAFECVHDKLTGLVNRAALIGQLERAVSGSHRQGKELAVLLLDVDDFKSINDSLGHAVGDELLVDLSHRLVAAVRAGDTVARFGGVAFVVGVG